MVNHYFSFFVTLALLISSVISVFDHCCSMRLIHTRVSFNVLRLNKVYIPNVVLTVVHKSYASDFFLPLLEKR